MTDTATIGRAIPRQPSEQLTEGALSEVVNLAWNRLFRTTLRPRRPGSG